MHRLKEVHPDFDGVGIADRRLHENSDAGRGEDLSILGVVLSGSCIQLNNLSVYKTYQKTVYIHRTLQSAHYIR